MEDDVRLNGVLLEVCYAGGWGFVCADSQNDSSLATSKFVCEMLNMSSNSELF